MRERERENTRGQTPNETNNRQRHKEKWGTWRREEGEKQERNEEVDVLR